MGDVNPLELELSNAEFEIAGKLLETFGGTSASWGGNRAQFSLWMSKCVFNTLSSICETFYFSFSCSVV